MLNKIDSFNSNLKIFKLESVFYVLIYFLPFSILQFSFLSIYKIPYSYLLLILLMVQYLISFNFTSLKVKKTQFILLILSIFWIFISYITNNNYSFVPVIGVVSRMITITLASLFYIDIKLLFKTLINSIPFYLIPVLFSDKLMLFESISINSNNLAASLISIILFIFLLKSKFTSLRITLLDYLKIIFPSFIVLIITESRSVLISFFLSIFLVNFFSQFSYLISFLKIKLSFIRFLFISLIVSSMIFGTIFTLNSSDSYFTRRYFLNNLIQSESNINQTSGSDLKRYFLFTYSIKDIINKPFFGNGAGNDQNVFKKVEEYTTNNNFRKSLHNVYLTVAYQFGIPLLVFLILFIRETIFINFRHYQAPILNVMIYFYVMLGFFNDIYAKNYFILILVLISFRFKSLKNDHL